MYKMARMTLCIIVNMEGPRTKTILMDIKTTYNQLMARMGLDQMLLTVCLWRAWFGKSYKTKYHFIIYTYIVVYKVWGGFRLYFAHFLII